MQKLNNIKSELSYVYLNSNDSIERYNIIDEMKKYMNELRSNFSVLSQLQNIVSELCTPECDVSELMCNDTVLLLHVFNELNLDSLDKIEIVMEIEKCFDIELDDLVLDDCQTINDIIKLIQK